jgi:predicted transcriptional regulator
MKSFASFFHATPLIVAESAGFVLEDNVVYSRHGVTMLNLNTFTRFVADEMLYFKSSNAGIVVGLNSDRFKVLRQEQDYSLNLMAKKLGVSVKMVQQYEQNICDVSYNAAVKIYELFGESVFEPCKIGCCQENDGQQLNSEVSKKYCSLGFNVVESLKVPGDVVARSKGELIITAVGDKVKNNLFALSEFLGGDNLIIFKSKKPKVEMPAIAEDEFLEFETKKEVISFLKEF